MKITLCLAPLRLLLVPCAAALLTIGCGEGNVLSSPTGPTGALGSTALTADDAPDSLATASSAGDFEALGKGGNPGGNGGGKDKGKSGDDDSSAAEPDDDHGKPDNPGNPGKDARVVGFVTTKTADSLTVRGVTVIAGTDAVIRHGNRTLAMADIEVGDHVQARGTMDGTTLVATEIKVEDTGHDNDDVDEEELEGAVSGLSSTATCPVVTFMIGTTHVTTSAATVFDDVTCATLANGAIVEVEGTTQADGSILATKVEAEAGPDEVEGTIFELSGTGTCPTLTFKVGHTAATATTVTTSGSTTFTGVTCAALANGTKVEVEGTKQADGSITAASVELD